MIGLVLAAMAVINCAGVSQDGDWLGERRQGDLREAALWRRFDRQLKATDQRVRYGGRTPKGGNFPDPGQNRNASYTLSTECRVPEARVPGATARDGAFDSRAAFPGDAVTERMPIRATRPLRGVSYTLSVAALIAANALDTASSWGRYEMNPALGCGPFGARQAGIKIGVTAAVLGAERYLLRRRPNSRGALTVLNFLQAAALGVVAGRNWAR